MKERPPRLYLITICDPSGKDCFTYGVVPTNPFGIGIPPMLPLDPETPCDRARASAAKYYKLADDASKQYRAWIKHIGEQSGQDAAVNSWLNELHSDDDTVENAIQVADHLGQILKTAATAYANGYKDINKLGGRLTEWRRAYTYSLNAANAITKVCGDSSDYDFISSAKPWNDAFYDESFKIVEDILKDWTPPH